MFLTKNFTYSVIIFFVIFLVCYYHLFSIPYYLIGFLIFITWFILIIDKREFSILFCILGYLHPFPSSQIIDINSYASFNILFVFFLLISIIILKIWTNPFPSTTKITFFIWLFICYQIIFSIIPNFLTGELSLATLLIEKDQFLGILIIYPAFYLGMNYFNNTVIFFFYFSICFTILLLMILFNFISLVELSTTFVNTGYDGVERLHGLQFGQLFKIFIYALPIVFLFKNSLKLLMIFIGISLYIILIFTFSRYEIIYITLGVLFSSFILFKFNLRGIKFFIYGFFTIFILLILSFNLISIYLPNIDIISAVLLTIEASNQSDSFYTFSHRFNTILPNQIDYLFSSFWNFIFGAGYNDLFRMNILTDLDLGIWDVPLTGTLAKFGVIGFSIYMIIYSYIFKEIIYLFNLLSIKKKNIIKDNDFILYAFCIILSSYFITCMVFRTYLINLELVSSYLMIEFSFLLGLFFSSMSKLRLKKINN